MTREQRGALAGLKVVDASTLYAAPFISTLLADHGADVVTGLTHMTGPADGAPVIPPVPLGDAVAGWAGAFGVLAACYHRMAHGGSGQRIDVNPVDAMLQVVGPMITEYADGEPPQRLGSRLRGAVVRNVFATGDGRWVSVGLSTPRQAEELAALVGHPDAPGSTIPGDLEASTRAWIAGRPRPEVVAAFVERRLPIAPVNDARDLVDDPHLRERGALRTLDTPEQGPVRSPAPAPRLLGSPAPPVDRLPTVGEHTVEVLSGEDPWR